MSKFDEFGEGSIDDVLAKMESDVKGKKANNLYWSPSSDFEGTYKIRFLPLLKKFDETIFYHKIRKHWLNGVPYLCLDQTLVDKNGKLHDREECPFCKKVKQLYSLAGDVKDSEERILASSMTGRDSFVTRIIVRGLKNDKSEDIETTPQFYAFGKTIFESLLNFIKSAEFGNFLSVSEGRDFNLVKSGKGRNAKYAGSYLAGTQTPVFTDKEKIKQTLQQLEKMDYKQLVEFTTAEEMSKVLHEYFNPSEEEEAPKVKIGVPANEKIFAAKEFKKEESKGDDELDDLLNSF